MLLVLFASRFGEDLSYTLDLHPRFPDAGFTKDSLPADAIDDLPSDGYDQNDVQRLCARLIHLCEMREEVLVRSGLSSVWFNKEACSVAHYCADSRGCYGSIAYSIEIVASLPDPRLAKKSKGPVQARVRLDLEVIAKPSQTSKKRKLKRKASEVDSDALELGQAEGMDDADLTNFCPEIEDSLKKDEGASTKAASAPIPRLGKRVGDPLSMAVVSASKPSHVGTSTHAFISGRSLSLGGAAVSGHVGKSGAEVLWRQVDPLDFLARSALACDVEYDQILKDDFGTTTHGEEIDLTLFPLAPGPYHMPYPYEGVFSPFYTKKEWDGPHAPECNILCKDIFKDPDVCRKALDRTITPAELRRTGSLLPLELSNRDKLDKKKGDVKLLRSEVTSLDNKLKNFQRGRDALGQENSELCSQRDAAFEETDAKLSEQALTIRDLQNEFVLERSKSQRYKDAMDVSNFHVGAKADFDKALDDFPTTPFPFLSKIVAASECSLSDVTQILSNKFIRSATSIAAAPSSANEALEQVPP
ncbi:hypothetical protein Tco_1405822 [Tanacetum coccineum]